MYKLFRKNTVNQTDGNLYLVDRTIDYDKVALKRDTLCITFYDINMRYWLLKSSLVRADLINYIQFIRTSPGFYSY